MCFDCANERHCKSGLCPCCTSHDEDEAPTRPLKVDGDGPDDD